MFFTGYFKKINERISETNQKYLTLEIPNEEVKYIFRAKVLKWFHDKVKAKDLSNLYTAIINGDTNTFEAELGMLLMETISFNDTFEKRAQDALDQIKDKGMIKNLKAKGIRKNIIKYGISFFEKDCYVKLGEY